MDSSPTAQSPDLAEPVPAFRRPANDTSRRHYRRHSPSSSRSPSPASPGGWKRDRSQSPSNSQELHGGSKAVYAAKRGRKDEAEKEVGREEGTRSRRDPGSLDHRSQGQSRDHYEKNEEYSYSRRHSGHHDRYYHSHYNSGRDSYRDGRSEYSRREGFGRSTRVDERSPDRTCKDRGDNESRDKTKEWNKERDKEREKERNIDRDRHRDRDRDFGPERGKVGVRRSDAETEENIEKSRDSAMGRERRDRSRDQEKDKGKEKDYERHRHREEQQERDRHKEKDELRERDRYKDRHDYKESDRQRQKEGFRESSRSKDKDENKDRDRLREDPKYQDVHRGRGDYEQGPRKSSHHHDVTRDGGKSSSVKERDFEHSKSWSGGDFGGDKTSSGDKHYDDSSTHEKEKASHKSSGGPDRIENEKRHPHEVLKVSDIGGSFKTDGRRHHSSDGDLKRIDDLVRDKQVSPEDAATGNDVDSVSKQVNTSLATADERLEKGSKWGPEAHTSSEASHIAPSEAEVSNDLDFAKMAAMRAAELVNKNLGAGGFMSTDQKKRLLWGSKKKTADQEVVAAAGTNRWDTVRFADRDRQEKFNKLMGVKGDFKGDEKIQEKDAGLFTAEKQQELQQELEKQFTAGLRRRDGRTVGLGL